MSHNLLNELNNIKGLKCIYVSAESVDDTFTSEPMLQLQIGSCGFCGKENQVLYPLCNSDPYCEECMKIVFNDCKKGLEEFKSKREQ